MPTYVYRCPDCQSDYEEVRLIADRDDDADCEQCSRPCERLLAAPAVMNHSYPDGTKRFDNLRQTRRLMKAISRERNKADKAKLTTELAKIPVKEAS